MDRILLDLRGGLGNQMIQYAYARQLADKYKAKLFLNKSYYKDNKINYELNQFNVLEDIPSEKDLQVEYSIYDFNDESNLFTINGSFTSDTISSDNVLLRGYFQTKKCMEDIDFKNLFRLESLEVDDYDVAIHIRGGDYVGWDFFDVITPDYYTEASKLISSSDRVIVFTNDREYADYCLYKVDDSKFIYDKGGLSSEILYRVSKAKKLIIGSNSSFSFCAMKLTDSDKVLPSRWFNTNKDRDLNYIADYIINP